MVANFRTEESQRRLLTAVIAAHPELKLNFKAIAQHFGPEDWGKDGIEHFFRPLKKDAAVVRKMVESGQPAKDFYNNKAWQFRGIKRDAEAMRQGKGATAASAASSVPVTPKSGRKRAAPTAPSTGKSTASKRARASSTKAVQQPPVINVEDDDDENEFPPILDIPVQGPRFTDSYAKQFLGTDAQTPALDMTTADTPNEEEDFKPHTPSDPAAYSFSQAPSSLVAFGGYNLDADPIGQPSFATGSGYSNKWVPDDFDDDEV